MIPLIPKELDGKIAFRSLDVFVKDGVTLTSEEQKLFEKFKSGLPKTRFEDDE